MATNTENVTLGNGTLYLNNVDVGHLKGDTVLTYKKTSVDFKPANMMTAVKKFYIGEEISLKATAAELSLTNLKLALGLPSTAITTATSFPSYDPSSYVVPDSASYDVMLLGGDKTVAEMSLRFEATRPDSGMKVIVVFYIAVSNSDLTLPFKEEDITLYDLQFTALADATRAEGDMVGFIVEQTEP
jgi:hypothetical protein